MKTKALSRHGDPSECIQYMTSQFHRTTSLLRDKKDSYLLLCDLQTAVLWHALHVGRSGLKGWLIWVDRLSHVYHDLISDRVHEQAAVVEGTVLNE